MVRLLRSTKLVQRRFLTGRLDSRPYPPDEPLEKTAGQDDLRRLFGSLVAGTPRLSPWTLQEPDLGEPRRGEVVVGKPRQYPLREHADPVVHDDDLTV